jgi:hypothetical protein
MTFALWAATTGLFSVASWHLIRGTAGRFFRFEPMLGRSPERAAQLNRVAGRIQAVAWLIIAGSAGWVVAYQFKVMVIQRLDRVGGLLLFALLLVSEVLLAFLILAKRRRSLV